MSRIIGFVLFLVSGIINTIFTVQAFNLEGISIMFIGQNMATTLLVWEHFPAAAALTTLGAIIGFALIAYSMTHNGHTRRRLRFRRPKYSA